jgi:hypothetical protein
VKTFPSAEQMAKRYRSLLAGESLPTDLRAWAEIGADVLPTSAFDRLREYLAVAADEIDQLRLALGLAKGERDEMREVLTASRDVLASFQKQAGYLPGQQAYSTRMTQGEMDLSRAVTAITNILSEEPLAPLPRERQEQPEVVWTPESIAELRAEFAEWAERRNIPPEARVLLFPEEALRVESQQERK